MRTTDFTVDTIDDRHRAELMSQKLKKLMEEDGFDGLFVMSP